MSYFTSSSFWLPNIDIPYEYDCNGEFKSFLFYSPEVDNQSYKELNDWIWDFLGGDCMAMTVNNEILFNFYKIYDSNMNFKERIKNEIYREQIQRNPHQSLLCHFPFIGRNQMIRIYMSSDMPWTMNIEYKNQMRYYQVSFSQSDELFEFNESERVGEENEIEKTRLNEELDEIVRTRESYYSKRNPNRI